MEKAFTRPGSSNDAPTQWRGADGVAMLRIRVASASDTDTESAIATRLQLYRLQKNVPALLQFLRNEADADHASTTNHRARWLIYNWRRRPMQLVLTRNPLTRNEK